MEVPPSHARREIDFLMLVSYKTAVKACWAINRMWVVSEDDARPS